MNDKQGWEDNHKIGKIFESKLQGSSRPLKRSLMKINLKWNGFVHDSVSRAFNSINTHRSFYEHPNARVFRKDGAAAFRSSPPKDKRILKKRPKKLLHAFKRLAVKAVETLFPIVGSFAGDILSFLGKAVEFVTEDR